MTSRTQSADRRLDASLTSEFFHPEINDAHAELIAHFEDAIAAQTRTIVGTIIGAGAVYTAMLGAVVALT